jgi:response regulator RpfG family c-di-GMP phosphodiesterase
LLVDDDEGLRALLRTTFEAVDVEVDEAADAVEARRCIRARPPDAIVLDVSMPGLNGDAYCAALKSSPATRHIPVVLLTGTDQANETVASEVGADAFIRKPFSPLDLLAVVERLAGGLHGQPFRATRKQLPDEQLLLYARDLRHLLELERGQRRLLEGAYRETVSALASALESKDTGTGEHSQRVHRYAAELARVVAPGLMDDESVTYGFVLHDVGKIGIPDSILHKAGPLTNPERRVMQTHTILGEQMLRGITLLNGGGSVVRSLRALGPGHGYPDGLSVPRSPWPRGVHAIADALDAMTNNRPYRRALDWAGRGPRVLLRQPVRPRGCRGSGLPEGQLRGIRKELAAA